MLKKVKGKVVSFSKNTLIAGSGVLLSASSLAAVDPAVKTAVETAYTDGGTLIALAVASLIGLVALMVGVGIVISLLKKG